MSGDELVVHDLYVDLVVPPTALRYEVLDLHELADALISGAIAASTAATALRDTQRFIDRHLRDLDTDELSGWRDFPPAAIADLATLPPFAAP